MPCKVEVAQCFNATERVKVRFIYFLDCKFQSEGSDLFTTDCDDDRRNNGDDRSIDSRSSITGRTSS